MMESHKKMKLSTALEKAIFDERATELEVRKVRELCLRYQEGFPSKTGNWKGISPRAYSQYLGFLAALKVRRALESLDANSYLQGMTDFDLIDFGAGTLGGSLGAVDFLNEKQIKVNRITAVDRSLEPMKWAREKFSDLLPPQVSLAPKMETLPNLDKTIVLAVDVLNEFRIFDAEGKLIEHSPGVRMINAWLKKATESSFLILISPASREWNQSWLRLRDYYAQKNMVLLPCTHCQACPALVQNEWCHEDRPYIAPQTYWSLVESLGFRRMSLQFSMLILGKAKKPFQAESAAVVSSPIYSKGRATKWLCADGKRWKASLLERSRNEKNEAFFEALRGDVVDSTSTGSFQDA